MKKTKIHTLTLQYKNSHFKLTTSNLKSEFSKYIKEHLLDKIKKHKINFSLAYGYNDDIRNQNYPLVQYNILSNNQIQIVAIDESTKLLKLFYKQIVKKQDFLIVKKQEEKTQNSIIDINFKTQNWHPTILPYHKGYSLEHWAPFNGKNIGNEIKFKNIIWGNLMKLLDDLNISQHLERKYIKIKIHSYKYIGEQKGSKINWLCYNVLFSSTINLPNHIGIGHEPRLGFGKISDK